MARCSLCGAETRTTVEMWRGGCGWVAVPHCADDEGCGLVYAAWLRRQDARREVA